MLSAHSTGQLTHKKKELKDRFDKHIAMKKAVRTKKSDLKANEDPKKIVACFDLQEVITVYSPVWSSIVRKTNMDKLQTVENAALRTATGQTKDKNTQ